MIADGDKHFFDAVLAYKLDHFARNRYDNVINKARLKKAVKAEKSPLTNLIPKDAVK